jgi:hypothetical protein
MGLKARQLNRWHISTGLPLVLPDDHISLEPVCLEKSLDLLQTQRQQNASALEFLYNIAMALTSIQVTIEEIFRLTSTQGTEYDTYQE